MNKSTKYFIKKEVAVAAIGIVVLFTLLGALPNSPKDGASEVAFAKIYFQSHFFKCLNGDPTAWRSDCMKNLAGDMRERFSTSVILEGVRDLEQQSLVGGSQCHGFMHYLGQEEYKYSRGLAESFGQSAGVLSACGQGYYHGVTEAYITSGGNTAKDFLKKVGSCDTLANEVFRLSCAHGIGHAAMLLTDNGIEVSLDFCETLDGDTNRKHCYSGVFMEDTLNAVSQHGPSSFQPEEPSAPCPALPIRYQEECYASRVPLVLYTTDTNWTAGISFCTSLPESNQGRCLNAVGNASTVHYANPITAWNITCKTMGEPEQTYCLDGILGTILSMTGGNLTDTEAFCREITYSTEECNERASIMFEEWK